MEFPALYLEIVKGVPIENRLTNPESKLRKTSSNTLLYDV